MADKQAEKAKLRDKYKQMIKDKFPEVSDQQWLSVQPSLMGQAILLANAETKGEDVEKKLADVLEKYTKLFTKDDGKEDKKAAAAAAKEAAARVRAEAAQAAKEAAAAVKAKAVAAAPPAPPKKVQGPAKTMEERIAEAEAAAAKSKKYALEQAAKANARLAKEIQAIKDAAVKSRVGKAAKGNAQANSAAIKQLADTLMDQADRNLKEAWKHTRKMPEAYKAGLAKVRAAGDLRKNDTLKHMKANNYIGRCSFCSKFCHSTRKNKNKSGARSVAVSNRGSNNGNGAGNGANANGNGANANGNKGANGSQEA